MMRGGHQRHQTEFNFRTFDSNQDWKKIIEGDFKIAVDNAQKLGSDLANGLLARGRKLKRSQMRKIFGHIKRLQMQLRKEYSKDLLKKELLILKPRLAYTASRHPEFKPFKDVLDKFINYLIDFPNKEGFDNFVYFIEAVLAYHREAGGKE